MFKLKRRKTAIFKVNVRYIVTKKWEHEEQKKHKTVNNKC